MTPFDAVFNIRVLCFMGHLHSILAKFSHRKMVLLYSSSDQKTQKSSFEIGADWMEVGILRLQPFMCRNRILLHCDIWSLCVLLACLRMFDCCYLVC